MNRITSLQLNDGRTCDDPEEVKYEILDFYQNMYLSQGYRDMADLLQFVPTRVIEAMNELLAKDFTAEEFKATSIPDGPVQGAGHRWFHCRVLPMALEYIGR